MTCREFCELLCDYVNGDLSLELCDDIRRHLEECPPCVHYEASYRLTITLSRRLPPAEMPPGAAERVLRKMTSDPPMTHP